MGIHYLPPTVYKCGECGAQGDFESIQSARPERPGTWKVIRCPKCGHETRTYQPSLGELEMGYGGKSFTYNALEPREF